MDTKTKVLQALRDAGYETINNGNVGATKKNDRFTFKAGRIQELAWWTFGISTRSGHEAITVIPEERIDITNIAYYEAKLTEALYVLESV
jgi:hypothetical protein